MGDKRRFNKFANLINDLILNKELSIIDVAAGKGHLQKALNEKGFRNVTSWDAKNIKKGLKRRYGLFKCNEKQKFDVIVAMHPDEATDHSILYAGKNKKIAIVCPCCIKPDATPSTACRSP